MSGINKVFLIGTVHGILKYQVAAGGNPVLKFCLLTTEEFLKAGQKSGHEEMHHIVMQGALADAGKTMLVTGQQIYVEGSIKTTHVTDNAGIRRYDTTVVAFKFEQMDLPVAGQQKRVRPRIAS